jgi:hypothetical protein
MTETPAGPTIPLVLKDGFASLELLLEGFAYGYDQRYLRAGVQIATRHFNGSFPADLEAHELMAFGQRCRALLGAPTPGMKVAFEPNAERYVVLQAEVQKTGKLRWEIACRPTMVATERFEFQITTETAALQPLCSALELATRTWPRKKS